MTLFFLTSEAKSEHKMLLETWSCLARQCVSYAAVAVDHTILNMTNAAHCAQKAYIFQC